VTAAEGDFGVSLEFNVRRLRVEDAGPLVALRREALETDPMAFGSSIADDRGLSQEHFLGELDLV
jgi:hypothetical protein